MSSGARYVLPFVVFVALLFFFQNVKAPVAWSEYGRDLFLVAVCTLCWPGEISWRPERAVASIGIGLLVFVVWIAPELLFPHYRDLWPFSNRLLGTAHSSLEPAALANKWIAGWRTLRAFAIVPVVEELFWRGWLMRWLIDADFQRVPLGRYQPVAFWLTAVLFASEHGPYWDVGLAAGIIYNLWIIRTRSLADCILAHAVTNGILSTYVVLSRQWQYWQ